MESLEFLNVQFQYNEGRCASGQRQGEQAQHQVPELKFVSETQEVYVDVLEVARFVLCNQQSIERVPDR